MKLNEIVKQKVVKQEDILASVKNKKITLDASNMHFVGDTLNLNGLHLTSLRGCPTQIRGRFLCWHNNLTTLEGCPQEVIDFRGGSLKITTLKGGPRFVSNNFFLEETHLTSLTENVMTVGKVMDVRDNNIADLHNIHKYILSIGEMLVLHNNPIKSHVLGLLKIEKLPRILMDNKAVQEIINKYLPLGDIFDCQEELIEAGFPEYAQL